MVLMNLLKTFAFLSSARYKHYFKKLINTVSCKAFSFFKKKTKVSFTFCTALLKFIINKQSNI